MNVKSLLLLLAFTGFGVSCNSDDPDGPGTGGIAGRTELQIAFSGTGESVEYDTKATASESENKIDKLEVYLFAAAAETGPYYFMEKWTEGTAFTPPAEGDPAITNFKKTANGTGWKASLYPNELKDYPFVKLYCVANNGAVGKDGEFFDEAGATQMLKPMVPTKDGVTTGATTETAFKASFTKALTLDADGIIKTPLLMTGTGATKISGSVSKVDIVLKRNVARFDIENNVTRSNLTITSVSLAQGRKTGALWNAVPGNVADLTTLFTYQPVDFTKLTGANQGVCESAFYAYPNLDTDKSYLILSGNFKSPMNSAQIPVTYNVPIQRAPAEGQPEGAYIPLLANSRYRLNISNVTQSNVYGTFEVVDWTSGGGIVVKPENDAPKFTGVDAFAAVTGDLPAAIGDSKSKFVVAEASKFTVQIAATGKVRCEKKATPTKAKPSPEWLNIEGPVCKDSLGVWYSTFTMTVDDATGGMPADVTFINESASYDPALWTTLTFYGPKAAPTLTDGGAGSLGNTVDYTTDPAKITAEMYNNAGNSFIKVKAMCIEGTKLVLPEGFKEVGLPADVEGDSFSKIYTIQVDKALTDGTTHRLQFQNSEAGAKAETVITVTAVAATMSCELPANSYATKTDNTITTDVDLLGTNSYVLNIKAPQGVTAVIPTGKWLTVEAGAIDKGVIPYTIKLNKGVESDTSFDLVFTNKLNSKETLTITMAKGQEKDWFVQADGSDAFNTIALDNPKAVTSDMYLVNGSKIMVKASYPDAWTFNKVDGLSAEKDGSGIYTISITDVTKFTAGTPIVLTATNTTVNTKTATITITPKDPAIKVTLTTNAAVVETTEGANTVYTVDFNEMKTAGFIFTVTAPYGATTQESVLTGTWLMKHGSSVGTENVAAKTPTAYQYKMDDEAQSADITLKFTNLITNGGDKTIIFKKKKP